MEYGSWDFMRIHGGCKQIMDVPLNYGVRRVRFQKTQYVSQRIQVPNNLVLGFWVIVSIVQVLGNYMSSYLNY